MTTEMNRQNEVNRQSEVPQVVVRENRQMEWFEVEVEGQTWRFPSMEMTMREVERMVGPVGFVWTQE